MANGESNKATLRRVFEQGLNDNDEAVFDEVVAPSYVNHDLPAPAPGPEGFKQVLRQFRAAFPDMHVEIEQMVSEGDRVCTRGRFSGTHQGEFMGVAASGKRFEVGYIDIWRLEDGKAVENWVQIDMLGLMQQLGAVPSP